MQPTEVDKELTLHNFRDYALQVVYEDISTYLDKSNVLLQFDFEVLPRTSMQDKGYCFQGVFAVNYCSELGEPIQEIRDPTGVKLFGLARKFIDIANQTLKVPFNPQVLDDIPKVYGYRVSLFENGSGVFRVELLLKTPSPLEKVRLLTIHTIK